jgi:polysaccharide export outer membrane protein
MSEMTKTERNMGKKSNQFCYQVTCVLIFLSSSLLNLLSSGVGSSFAQNNDYRIGPRDVVTISIYASGEKEQEVDLTVSAQGTINVPFIGNTKAEGLTPEEVEKHITQPLAKDYFVDPKVIVRIKEYHSLHYYISGAVKKPGLYETDAEVSLLELIAKAEGVLPDRAAVAYIMRDAPGHANGETEPIKVDLKNLLDKGDMTANLELAPGDVVYIPLQTALDLATSKIYIEGEVKSPGIYDYRPGLTAMNACIMAGGFAKFAAPNRTRIIRKSGDQVEIIKVDLNDVKDGDDPDVELQPGDRIHVPETWL